MIIYGIIILIMSFITYVSYAIDKKNSIKGKWRTKEKTLLFMSILFGALGGLLSMYTLRHKTNHWYFVVINWISLLLHFVIGYFIYSMGLFDSIQLF
ncbi:MAG: DUF1294 domain-containing protein [Acholeplasmataceae bacterium]|nr:DUF1294 domain-containing protein [Acholeplasmataceae bacterium]